MIIQVEQKILATPDFAMHISNYCLFRDFGRLVP